MKIEQPPNFMFFKRTWEANGHDFPLQKKNSSFVFFLPNIQENQVATQFSSS
jgi:hypothetical protein